MTIDFYAGWMTTVTVFGAIGVAVFAYRLIRWGWGWWRDVLDADTVKRASEELQAYMRDTQVSRPAPHPGSAAPSSVEPPASSGTPSALDAGHTLLPAAAALTLPGGGQASPPVGAQPPDRAPTGTAVEATTAQPLRVASTARSTAA